MFSRRNTRYQVCTQCIMDTSDPEIEFDDAGICSHCKQFDRRFQTQVFTGESGARALGDSIATIKEEGKGKPYDCIIGISGGVDSTYVAWLVKRYGLRPLAVHLDNGWNSELAVKNIENIVTRLDLDLHTEVLDWDEFRGLQLAFLKASTPDSEVPTDHAIVATLYRLAYENDIHWVVEGSNVATEAMVPRLWSKGHSDWRYIKSVNEQFGRGRLKTYPHYTLIDRDIRFKYLRSLKRFPILNYVDYVKREAMSLIKRELGWRDYGGKHYESVYTRFYQGFILPVKFGFDKRRPHYSCLIRNGELERSQALSMIQQPALDPEVVETDRAFVAKKLGLSAAEFDEVMALPCKTFWDYPSYEKSIRTQLLPAYAYAGLNILERLIRRARRSA